MEKDVCPPHNGYDLLKIKAIRALVLWSGFPYVFQALMLIVFVSLAILGWGLFAPEDVADKLFAKTNLVNLLIWGLWWPTMVWVAVLFGRAWCMICPLEFVSYLTERLAQILKIRQYKLNKWLRSGALIVGLYALIQMLIAGAHLHRVPAYTSIFLWALLASASIVGFFFKDRAFCRGFCPVGLLLNAYGRGGMLAVRAGTNETCTACTGKDCIIAYNRERFDKRSCPSLLNPPKLNSNKDCLVCGQCIKACDPDNMQLVLRRPFHPADARENIASWPLTLFVMLVSGFVTYELTSEWAIAKQVFLWLPQNFSAFLPLPILNGWIQGAWTLFIFPLVLWTILGAITRVSGGAKSLTYSWRQLALPVVIIVSAGHITKGLAKLTSWAGYLPFALKEPRGIMTAQAMSANTISQPESLFSMTIVSIIGVLLLLLGFTFALREARLASPGTPYRRFVPKFVLTVLFVYLVFGWGAGALFAQ